MKPRAPKQQTPKALWLPHSELSNQFEAFNKANEVILRNLAWEQVRDGRWSQWLRGLFR